MKNWYDGYHFGDFDVYCPWDVMNYLRDIQEQPGKKPASYWKNTSDNAIIRSFIDYAGNSITNKLETLCKFRINGAPFSRQRCKRLAPAVCCPFIACL